MVIDFRVRPPYKSFVDSEMFPRPITFDNPRTIKPLQMYPGKHTSVVDCSFDTFMREMDAAEVDMAVIHGRNSDGGDCHVPNTEIVELVQKYPDRFVGFGGIDIDNIDEAVKEIHRCVKEYGMKGIAIEPGYGRPARYIDDEALTPIYETCRELGAICSITSSIFVGPDLSYTNPVHLHRVVKKYKDVKFTIPHAAWPYVAEILGVALHCTNVYLVPDFYGFVPNMPLSDEYVKAANYYMKYRMLFASSYPVRALDQAQEFVKAQGYREDVLEHFMWKNAAELLGLDIKEK